MPIQRPTLPVLLLLLGAGACASHPDVVRTEPKPSAAEVRDLLGKVADWQMTNHKPRRMNDWTEAALDVGLMRYARVAPDTKTQDWLMAESRKLDFSLIHTGWYRFHADFQCIGQLYLELFKDFRQPAMFGPVKAAMDDVVANQPDISTAWEGKQRTNRWNWADSLFMGPPTFTRLYSVTGDGKYLDWAQKEYAKTAGSLWSEENGLFFRDESFLPSKKLEKNGKPIFWGRGNGWVFAGLANMLPDIPKDHPSRAYYEAIFKKMARSLKDLQQPDGAWHASLLDPASYPVPETSGTAFFVYGLAWGVNQGILDKAEYLPAIEKGWNRLTASVFPDGKLGFVQPIGGDPQQVSADMTEVYGVGGFLLAGTEIWRMKVEEGATRRVEKTVANPAAELRRTAVSLDAKEAGLNDAAPVLVLDADTCAIVPAQTANGTLTFAAPLGAKQSKKFLLLQGGAAAGVQGGVAESAPCFGRFVPERMDDFAWENDRTAHRVYGPTLEHTKGEHFSGGVDVWSKRVRTPVVDRWYKAGHYHQDHGEGMDQYDVNATCGCGGTAILEDGKLVPGHDFISQKLVESGPARVVFELAYPPFPVKQAQITETKRFTLNRGENFTRVESRFRVSGADKATLAVGLLIHPGMAVETAGAKNGIALWESAPSAKDGFIGTAAVLEDRACRVEKIPCMDSKGHACDHLALVTEIKDGDTVNYRLGATWSKMEDFNSATQWFDEMRREADR